MSMARAAFPWLLLALGVGILALFYVQNEQTRVVLWLNLGLWAARTREPVAVPLIVLGSAAAGAALAGGSAMAVLWRMQRRTQRLRRELLALETRGTRPPGPGAGEPPLRRSV